MVKNSVESTHLSESVYNILKDLYDEYTRTSLLNKSSSGGSCFQSQGSWSHSQEQVRSYFCENTVLPSGVQFEDMENVFDEIVKET